MSTIIKGGTLVTESDRVEADLVMERGRIVAVGDRLTPRKKAEVVDARGAYVMPGAIDAHVHFQLPFCGTVSSDDFENGTKAAACGAETGALKKEVGAPAPSRIGFKTPKKSISLRVSILSTP